METHSSIFAWRIPWTGDIPDPEIKLRSPALQADYLPSKPPGKPKMEINLLIGGLGNKLV